MAPGMECLLLGKETVGQSENLVSIALGPGTVLGALWLPQPLLKQKFWGRDLAILLPHASR